MQVTSSARRDAVAALAFVVAAGFLCVHFEPSERLYGLTRQLEPLQLDEVPYILLALSFALLWYARRRTREAERESAARRAAEERLQQALSDLRRLSSERLESQEQERKAIARDLHDDLGQHLTVLQLDALQFAGELPVTRQRELADRLERGIQQLHERIRNLISRLRPVALDELGLGAALEHFIGLMQSRQPDVALGLDFDVTLDGLDEATSMTVYRVVQEGVVNALRHAGATRVQVSLQVDAPPDGPGNARIRIEDDGRGAGPAGPRPGFGLRGMRERLEAAGGALRFGEREPHGLWLEATLPLHLTGGIGAL